MSRVGFALGLAALFATAGSLTGTAASPFEQKLSKDKQAMATRAGSEGYHGRGSRFAAWKIVPSGGPTPSPPPHP